jgi:hypothetical protein
MYIKTKHPSFDISTHDYTTLYIVMHVCISFLVTRQYTGSFFQHATLLSTIIIIIVTMMMFIMFFLISIMCICIYI